MPAERPWNCCLIFFAWAVTLGATDVVCADHIAELQAAAVRSGRSEAAHWGPEPSQYQGWGSHSNRLIPVYTYGTKGAGTGIDLDSYTGKNSPYRSQETLRALYGRVPEGTLAPEAEYLDQTNLAELQRAALAAGKKHVFLVVFDGMDWQTTQAAAIHNRRKVAYVEGRGTGMHFQDYTAGGTSQFGFMVTSPHNAGTEVDVDEQRVLSPGGKTRGGYDPLKGGPRPWNPGSDPLYIITRPSSAPMLHAYTDSSSSATSMTAGAKTYNNAVNVDATGAPLTTVAHLAQDRGYAVGVVSCVPFSHATPAAAYAQNVHRDDYQDLSRDLLGLPSITHPQRPLPGMDVVIGGGYGVQADEDSAQGKNFVPGNVFVTADDLQAIDVAHGGRYVTAVREPGVVGARRLKAAADEAARTGRRLFGFYGLGDYKGHLPYATANGDYQPVAGRSKAERYTPEDLSENPTLAEMTAAALVVLEKDPQGFWLLVEPGDVDWANHDNNLDNSIGAVNSGDAAVRVITDWVEQNSNWHESLLIVTADHGHYLVLDRPELLIGSSGPSPAESGSGK